MSARAKLSRWLFVLIVCAAGLFSCLHLSINDNALDLLPRQAVSGDIEKLKNMGLVDRIFLTVTREGDPSGTVSNQPSLFQSVDKLGLSLEKSGLFSFVLYRLPKGYETGLMGEVETSLPFLLDEEDYAKLREKVSPTGIRQGLKQAVAMLNSPAGIGLKSQIQQDPLGFSLLGFDKFQYLRSEFSMAIEDGYFMSRDRTSCLLIAESTKSLTDSESAAAIDDFLRKAYSQFLGDGIRVTVIGSLPHTLANARTIQGDLKLLLPAATVLLVLLLGITLRTYKIFLVLGIPFMAAPVAIALTNAVYGQMSRMALGFGIVLLGIAVDFSIHLFIAQSGEGADRATALQRVRKPILYATLTSAAVFVVLLFSDVPSHRQMATLALAGLLLAVFFSALLVPTIESGRSYMAKTARSCTSTTRGNGVLLFCWAVFLGAGALCWTRLHYNGDLRVLDVPDKSVIADERFFASVWGEKGEQAFVLAEADDLEVLLQRNFDLYSRLQKDGGFKKMQSLAPLLPSRQMQAERLQRWRTFWDLNRERFRKTFTETALQFGFREHAFEPFWAWLENEPQPISYQSYLDGPMAPLVRSMVKETVGKTPEYHMLTTVGITGDNLQRLTRITRDMEGVTVIANARWRGLVEQELRRDVLFLTVAAGLVVLLLAAVQFRSLPAVCAVVAPVLSALSAMALYSWWSSGELNMMHLIMGIMVIGLSVDYGIFTVCSRLDNHHQDSAFAVSICAASSLIGFGVLAFAAHPALHSLGVTVLAGIGAAWPTAVWVSPTLLEACGNRRK